MTAKIIRGIGLPVFLCVLVEIKRNTHFCHAMRKLRGVRVTWLVYICARERTEAVGEQNRFLTAFRGVCKCAVIVDLGFFVV